MQFYKGFCANIKNNKRLHSNFVKTWVRNMYLRSKYYGDDCRRSAKLSL